MDQAFQILGALLMLLAFGLGQTGHLTPQSYRYLVLNVIGSLILEVVALVGRQWGFFLLEGTWSLVSLWGLWTRFRGDHTERTPIEVGGETSPNRRHPRP